MTIIIRVRLLLAYLVFILLTACAVLSGFVFLFADPRRLKSIGKGLDQACNAALGGDEDETISSAVGKMYYFCWYERGPTPPWWASFVWWFTDLLEPGHVFKAIEPLNGRELTEAQWKAIREMEEKENDPK